MQQYHGIVQAMADTGADFVFLPMLRDLPPVKDEKHTWLCPIVQASPDVVRLDLGKAPRAARALAGHPHRRGLPRERALPRRRAARSPPSSA